MYKKYKYVHISEYSYSGYAGDRGDRKSTIGYLSLLEKILRLGEAKSKMQYLAQVQKLSIEL